jgi:hypothetical protein
MSSSGSNVHVSREFGEVGYVDLMFADRDGTSLLAEVKIKPEEKVAQYGRLWLT